MENKELVDNFTNEFDCIIAELYKGGFEGEIETTEVDRKGEECPIKLTWELKIKKERMR